MASKIRIVSFADGPFRPRRPAFVSQATSINIFDDIVIHDISTLPYDFVKRHGDFMRENQRGFGYWIWKPLIVLETLRSSAREDIIFYADVGFTINPAGRRRILEYAAIAEASSHKMLSFSNTHTEYMWTKRDLAVRLGVEGDVIVMATTQLAAGMFVLQPTKSNIDLMEHWTRIATEDNYHFSDDTPSIGGNDSRFIEHRHDASIGSLIRKIRGTEITHYEVQSYHASYKNYEPTLPMLATRLRK
jgi:hypothetical protein